MIYGIPEPTDTDAVEIVDWSIKEVIFGQNEERTYHLVGFIREERSGRVSSAITTFDSDQRLIETSSGRFYRLCGESGVNPDANYVWGIWKKRNDVRLERDVSDRFLSKSLAT